MFETSQNNGSPSANRVTGAATQAVVRLLSDRGVPATEVVVTRAERLSNGESGSWVITVLRGRERKSHAFPEELVDKVLARGPCDEWYTEVGRMLEVAGMAFPA
jgi:type IV pilus biogenesis protein CpaD/CtpE